MIELPDEEVHVWTLDTETVTDLTVLARSEQLLSAHERERHERIRPPESRHLYLVSHVFVRRLLSQYVPVPPEAWEFDFEGNGKPKIIRPVEYQWLRFNLSHTHGLAACGVAREMAVGVDVEDLLRKQRRKQQPISADQGTVAYVGISDNDCLPLARYCMAPPEVEHLIGLEGPERWLRFLRYWTLKESYLKACATGISRPLQDFAFSWCDGHPAIEFLDGSDAPTRWRFAEHRPTNRHVAAAAVIAPSATITWDEFIF